MTCRSCGEVSQLQPGEVRSRSKAAEAITGGAARWAVDPAAGVGTFICQTCSQAQNLNDYRGRLRKRLGHGGAAERIAAPAARWRSQHPDAWADAKARGVAASVATRKGQSLNLTPEQLARSGLAHMKLTLRGQLSLCSLCDRLVWTMAGEIARYPDGGRQHARCIREWRHRERRDISTQPPGTSQRGRGRSPDELMDCYVAAVRLFRLKHAPPKSHMVDRDTHGHVRSVAWLAADLGTSPSQLYRRVERFLSLLPDEGRATGMVKVWRDVFFALDPPTADD